MAKNCPEFIPSLFGILHAGGVVVPINNFLKTDEVSFILGDAGVEVLVTDAELGSHFRALAAARPGLRLFQVEELDEGNPKSEVQPAATARQRGESPKSDPLRRRDSAARRSPKSEGRTDLTECSPVTGLDARPSFLFTHHGSRITGHASLAVLIYTSGTTGRPKGAMLSHGNLLHNVESCRIVLQTVAADRFAVLLPLFHSYMLTVGLLLPLLVGGSVVLVKSLHPVRNVLQEILQRQATVLPAIPQFYRSMVNAPIPRAAALAALHQRRRAVAGPGAQGVRGQVPHPAHRGLRLERSQPGGDQEPARRHAQSRAPSACPSRMSKSASRTTPGASWAPSEIGEVCVRGGNVMLGYWNQPEETAKVMRNGWLLTGDIGYRDARRLLLHHRPQEGHAAGQRHQRLSARDRGNPLPIPRREGGGGHRQTRLRAKASSRLPSSPPMTARSSRKRPCSSSCGENWPITRCPGKWCFCPPCPATRPARFSRPTLRRIACG